MLLLETFKVQVINYVFINFHIARRISPNILLSYCIMSIIMFLCLHQCNCDTFSFKYLDLFFLLPTLWSASLARLIMLMGISERAFYQQTWRSNFFSILTRGFGRINWKIHNVDLYFFITFSLFRFILFVIFALILLFVPNLIYQLYYEFFQLS